MEHNSCIHLENPKKKENLKTLFCHGKKNTLIMSTLENKIQY